MQAFRPLQLLALSFALCAQDHSHHGHDVDKKGDRVMGFPHDRTTHHFLLYASGGAIEVGVNHPDDAENRAKIRSHLRHIAVKFSAGDFEMPMLIHSRVVPGSEVMLARRQKIEYRYEDTGRGGRVSISTTDKQALAAIHEFLRFQIRDHRTGDSEAITTASESRPR